MNSNDSGCGSAIAFLIIVVVGLLIIAAFPILFGPVIVLGSLLYKSLTKK